MSEKLTKTAIKEELRRRIKWYEESFDFDVNMSSSDLHDIRFMHVHFGRYRSYVDMLWQIENGCFEGGFVC